MINNIGRQTNYFTLCVSMEIGVVMSEAHTSCTSIEVGIVLVRHNVCASIKQL